MELGFFWWIEEVLRISRTYNLYSSPDAVPLNGHILIGVSTATLKQGPIICRGPFILPFSLLNTFFVTCSSPLRESSGNIGVVKHTRTHTHFNKEQLHTLVPQPRVERGMSALHSFIMQFPVSVETCWSSGVTARTRLSLSPCPPLS